MRTAQKGKIQMSLITTGRLMLRMLTRDDLDSCFLASIKPNAGWMPHGTRKETRHLLETVYIGKEGIWGIVLRESGQLIGSIGLMRDYKREYDRVRSIGYAINEECWGQGYATEAAQAVLAYGFEQKGLEMVSAYAYPWNKGSKRVLEKCGFQYEGTLKLAVKMYDGSIYDNDCYAITREQWVDWLIENR